MSCDRNEIEVGPEMTAGLQQTPGDVIPLLVKSIYLGSGMFCFLKHPLKHHKKGFPTLKTSLA